MKISDYTAAFPVAHWMPWHGTSGHVPLLYKMRDGSTRPYVSSDAGICADQCANMKDMGIGAVNAYFKGPDAASTLAVMRMLDACENAGLEFSICIDHSAVDSASNHTAEYIRNMVFLNEVFFISPWYLRDNGRAVVTFFGEATGTNWTQVRAGITTATALLFNGGQFSHAEGDGCFGWVNPDSAHDINTAAVNSFINDAAAAPTKIAMYPGYPGFEDSLASWGTGRYMPRAMGKTLKTILGMIPTAAHYAMLATWNDHEEGSGLESGVIVA